MIVRLISLHGYLWEGFGVGFESRPPHGAFHGFLRCSRGAHVCVIYGTN